MVATVTSRTFSSSRNVSGGSHAPQHKHRYVNTLAERWPGALHIRQRLVLTRTRMAFENENFVFLRKLS